MIVPDASATVLMLYGDPDIDSRAAAAISALHDDPAWIVPEHWRIEVLAATRGLLRGGKIDAADAESSVNWLREVTTVTVPTAPCLARIWELRSNLSVYDAGYVAIAEAHQVTLVTADVRIQRSGGARCPVQLIG